MENLIAQLLEGLGENPVQDRLKNTPALVSQSLRFLTSGTHVSPQEVVKDGILPAASDDLVVLKNTEFYSLCEHHLLPFFGQIHVAYKPKDKILGLGTIARIIDLYARRLQIQERLTSQIADALVEVLDPHGVLVVGNARHFCMMMRGVKQNPEVTTESLRGEFRTNSQMHRDVLSLLAL